ncbi:hypothetical protein ACFXGA_05765 [Actinosynnema sp. NPDC059335]|uniref:hypothetical protein n=1 Tax=Actinosynnema sp. NPDC059335 TaxID=3346804 RepID=UPI003671695D
MTDIQDRSGTHKVDIDAYEAIRRGAQAANLLPDGFLVRNVSVVFEAVGESTDGDPVFIRGRYHPIPIGLGSERGILETAVGDVIHELQQQRTRAGTG